MIGNPKDGVVSLYQPSQEVCDFTAVIKKDYALGDTILNQPWVELNDRSVIEDQNRGQMMFNAFVDTSIEDEAEAWKWRGTRSEARNKGIAMHANLTANFLLPTFVAQNDDDEVDQDFSEVMRELIEWMAQPNNSNYQSSFLQMVFAMETNPITYLGAEFFEVMQTIRMQGEDGKYTTKEIVDQVLSGFQAPIYSADQVLLTNAYQRDMQRQRRIIKRRYVEKSELEARYKDHPNWYAVQEGIRSIYNESDGLFYDVQDADHTDLVSEDIALCRRDDSEVCFLGGVYMGNMDSIEDNPIAHRDNRDAPKYNITPFGYYRIGEHFVFYKSMMNALGWDNDLYDAMTEVVMNNALLEQDPPVGISGADEVDSAMNFPGATVSFEDKDTKITPIFPPKNFAAGFKSLQETADSISKSSLSDTASGELPEASQKAYTVAAAAAASKKLIKGVGASLGESVISYGSLMKDIALNHITAPEVDELVSGTMKLKYRTFLLKNKAGAGKIMDKQIKFDSTLIGSEMTAKEKKYASLQLLETANYPDSKNAIRLVNPELFAKFNYYASADLEEMFNKNSEYWQPILLNLKTALANDPTIDQEFLSKKLGYAYFNREGEDIIKKQAAPLPGANPAQPNPNPAGNPLGAMVQNKALSTVATGAVA